uniref:Uncharacterized protein n=1 Tax=Rhizophora mucronata TaxID=61149 RepID=A0A2P2IPA1_RHIMU
MLHHSTAFSHLDNKDPCLVVFQT